MWKKIILRGRKVLVWSLLSSFFCASAQALSLNAIPPTCAMTGGDGRLVLYSDANDEVREFIYRRPDGAWDESALRAMFQFFRSPDGATRAMDRRLVQLLDQIQDHFGVDVIEIISGYRSPAYNAKLKAEGHAVASDSRHMEGDAADVHVDDITEIALRDYAQSLRCGGVGFYPALHFVHLDFGPIRQWGEGSRARKLVGERPIMIETERNYYRRGETVTWKDQRQSPTSPLQLQHFSRGQWTDVQSIPAASHSLLFQSGLHPHGKYRLRTPPADTLAYSNEFYFKQQ